ncbi:hypothetical protein QTI33_08490 [Variovorax sp. J22P271]|uniref:hypothetical protein n=1 Tax=Variovorax davisae TaxID=3053515 RepID=UPI0025789CF1|nr:hypothetical protein [Variovorax sp. J22P271]MDM0032173.1 hypothetical protein [Variovorax sp. J22P271]
MKKSFLQPLRKVTVYVEETSRGAFRWVMGELEAPTHWQLFESGRDSFKTYHAAMAAGLLALEGQVADLERGPRAEPSKLGLADGAATPSDAGTEAADDPSDNTEHASRYDDTPGGDMAAKPGRRAMVFGFGPIS